MGLAERLVGGLSSENERWGREIDHLRDASTTLIGDCMLAAGFVSYVGSFDQGRVGGIGNHLNIEPLLSA